MAALHESRVILRGFKKIIIILFNLISLTFFRYLQIRNYFTNHKEREINKKALN